MGWTQQTRNRAWMDWARIRETGGEREREGSRSDAKWSEIKRGERRGRGGEEEEEESGGGEGHPPTWQRKSADLCSSKQPLSLFLPFLPSGQHGVSKSPTLIPFLFLCTSLLLRLMRNLSTQRGGDKKPSLLPWEPLEGGTFHLQWRRREQRCSGETEEGEVRRSEDTFCIPRSKVGRSVGRSVEGTRWRVSPSRHYRTCVRYSEG